MTQQIDMGGLDVRRIVVDPETDCWLWTGLTDSNGYGRLNVSGKHQLVHRLVYQIFIRALNAKAVADDLFFRAFGRKP